MILYVHGLFFSTSLITIVFFDQYLVQSFAKNILVKILVKILVILTLSPTLNLKALWLDSFFFSQSRIININKILANGTMTTIIAFTYQFIQITKISFSTIRCRFLTILAFKVLIILSATLDLRLLCVEYNKISLPSNHFCVKLT